MRLPVEKSSGAKIYAGTVNQSGQLIARVTSMGEETALAHIIAAVARAQSSRANIQRLGDRVSSVFVPIVVLIALATAAVIGAMSGYVYRYALTRAAEPMPRSGDTVRGAARGIVGSAMIDAATPPS